MASALLKKKSSFMLKLNAKAIYLSLILKAEILVRVMGHVM